MKFLASANTQCGINKRAGLPAKNEGNMYSGEMLPRTATAMLIIPAFGRKVGEMVAHSVDGNTVTVTFLSTSFSGGISRQTITVDEFKTKFKVIGEGG